MEGAAPSAREIRLTLSLVNVSADVFSAATPLCLLMLPFYFVYYILSILGSELLLTKLSPISLARSGLRPPLFYSRMEGAVPSSREIGLSLVNVSADVFFC